MTYSPNKNNNLIYLVYEPSEFSAHLIEQCISFGYVTKQFSDFEALTHALMEQDLPLAVIMDLDFGGARFAGATDVSVLLGKVGPIAPFIFTTKHCDIDSCLESVRGGGVACIKVPDENQQVIEKINQLSHQSDQADYRILIITKEGLRTDLMHAMRQEGLVVERLNDARKIFEEMIAFSPDLILMDIFLDGCSGIQLARVIRQDGNFVSTPIAFMSNESSMQQEFDPLALGGDEFIMTNRSMDMVINAICHRAERSRVLNSLMVKDSLTGLYNHSRSMEMLEIEISRANRENAELCFAMIDIDHFKEINDTYGHAVGDTVIKALSRLLQQRLRRTDVIGRYGGEEFAIILPNTTLEKADSILNGLRVSFHRMSFKADLKEFHVSFSAGLTDYRSGYHANINDLADQALYRAKNEGRNRIHVIANGRDPYQHP